MSNGGLARRTLLGAAGAGVVAAGACSPTNDEPAEERQSESATPKPGDFQESPMLTELVDAGELPPVQDRLPQEPYVVRPGVLVADKFVGMQVGKYGGTLQLNHDRPAWSTIIFLGNFEPLLWAPGGFDYDSGIEGNVLAGYEVNADDTVFVFHLREGLKWSDGEPVTIEDVRFAFEDVLYNEDVTPLFPRYLRPGLRSDAPPVELEIIDDLTFELTFSESYGTFPAQLAIAQWHSYSDIIKPRHYLEQFHEKYADPADLKELLAQESIAEDAWFELFIAKNLTTWLDVSNEQFLGHPTLTAWVMESAQNSVYRYRRNPYYFKIDHEGNQLPYVDEIRSQVVQDTETFTSRALFGEFDYLGEQASLRQLPLIAEKADAGEVKMHLGRVHRLPINFMLNLTYPDDGWREIVRDVRFRQALSMAINREEILENFYLGEFASLPKETNVADFDVDGANRLLDEMGLVERDDDGFRVGADGRRFQIPFEITDMTEDHVPMGELIAEYWNEIGVHTTVRQIDATARDERQAANDLQATALWSHHDIWRSAGWDDYLPSNGWGQLWQDWFESGGELGEEPPDEVKELFESHGRFMSATIGSEESSDALEQILASHRENVWTFNPVEAAYDPTFWTSRVQNVAEGVREDVLGIVLRMSMEQWYIDE